MTDQPTDQQQPDQQQPDQQQPDPQTCHRCERPLLGEDTVLEVETFIPADETPDGVVDIVEFGERYVHISPCAEPVELEADRDGINEAERATWQVGAEEQRDKHNEGPLRDPDDYGSLA